MIPTSKVAIASCWSVYCTLHITNGLQRSRRGPQNNITQKQPQFPLMMMRKHWLVKVSPNRSAQTSFQIDPKHFRQIATEFYK